MLNSLFRYLLPSLLIAATCCEAGFAPAKIYSLISPSVAQLSIETKTDEVFVASAFLVLDDQTIATAWHAVYDAKKVVATFSGGESYEVLGVIDYNAAEDVALLRLPRTGRSPVSLSSLTPEIGSWVYAIGAPRGYGGSIVEGLLSGLREIEGIPQYQVSCPFSPGNSGGPIVNESGEVFGIAAWSKRNAQNLNFAMPIRHLMALNSDNAVVFWEDVGDEYTHRASSGGVSLEKDSFNAFKESLVSRSGETVTIIVKDGDVESRFLVEIP